MKRQEQVVCPLPHGSQRQEEDEEVCDAAVPKVRSAIDIDVTVVEQFT